MGSLMNRRTAVHVTAALIVVLGGSTSAVHAQSATDARFDALVSLAEAKMKEYGVPGVALGIVRRRRRDDPRTRRHERRGSAARHRAHGLSHRVHLQDVRGDGDDAARRAGKGRPACTGAHVHPDFRVRDEAVSRDVTVWHLLTHLGGWEGQVSGPERGTETLKNFVASITDLMQVAPPGRRGATTTRASASRDGSSRWPPERPSIARCAISCSSR